MSICGSSLADIRGLRRHSHSGNKFPTELKKFKYEIEDHALACGLDFFPVIFEVLDYQEINEVAAYSGFPLRYPHWYFGMHFEEVSKSYAYGLSKIYEMVINNDPCYAYLLKCNHLIDQKLVMAHVYGHCDFFKNNLYFAYTNRKMMDEMANHATRIQRYEDRYGSRPSRLSSTAASPWRTWSILTAPSSRGAIRRERRTGLPSILGRGA